MKKLFLILIILSIPTSVFAGTREIDMWTDFNALVQPDPVLEYSQNNMSARYHADQTKLTDTITYSM